MKLSAKVKALRELPAPESRRAIREKAGVSQDDIAAEVGVTRTTISRYESGLRRPSGRHLLAYVRVLNSLKVES